MKTKVAMNCDDNQYQEWKKGETGYIDGYVRGGTDAPLAAVVLKERIVLAAMNQLKVIGLIKSSEASNNNG